MKKSVYSLVLSDSVVEAVDRAAYLNGQSRSNYINSVLAEHLSYVTPEKRMKNIFDVLEELSLAEQNFRIQKQQSDSMFSLLSSLQYKYRPTIRYSIELYPVARNGTVGEFKVIYRTQSNEFERIMKNFFIIWAKKEQNLIGKVFAKSPIKYTAAEGRLTRTLKLSGTGSISESDFARVVSDYIQMFDRTLKEYISAPDDTDGLLHYIDKEYSAFIKNSVVLV